MPTMPTDGSRPCRWLALFAAAAIPLQVITAADAPGARRPNVILILADDLGYGDLSLHGNPRLRTPELDRLGRESVRFNDHHVAPMCTPTRGELMTGLDAFRNGATSVADGRSIVRRDVPLLPEMLRAAGYATAHFGKWHLGDNHPFRPHDRGFDFSIRNKGFGVSSLSDHWLNDGFDDHYWRNDELVEFKGYNTDVFFQEAMSWIGGQSQPFFVYLAPTAAHEPHYVPSRYAKPYEDLPGVLPAFYGMAANLDENVGRLRRFLAARGLDRDTILIYMTDNGSVERTGFYTAGMRGRKGSLYDGGHRVPFFLHWPGGGAATAPRTQGQLTHGPDLVPTLLDLCGVAAPVGAEFDGSSLRPLLRGDAGSLSGRSVVVQYGTRLVRFKEWDCAVLRGQWRLVKGAELYDIGADPAQSRDVAAEHPDVVKAMRAHYEMWLGPTKAVMDLPNYIVVGSEAEKVVTLSANEWNGPFCDEWSELKEGAEPKFGYWDMEAAMDGAYSVSLYLFPPESATPLGGAFRAAPARPVRAAQLSVDADQWTREAPSGATHVEFEVTLRRGDRRRIEGRFLGAEGQPIWGAVFVVIKRVTG
jgi:arylsulfatase A-like enzyme